MLDGLEVADRGGDGCERSACQPGSRGGGHGVLYIVAAAYGDLAGIHQELAVEPDFAVGQPDAGSDRAGAAEPERRSGGERSIAHAGGVVGVENGERTRL